MGKGMQPGAIRLSQDELRQICELAVEKGIEAFDAKQESERRKYQKKTDKVEVTKRRLRDYRAVKKRASEAAITESEIPQLRFNALEDLMGQITSSDERTERMIRSQLNKKLSDTLELREIEKAYKEYEEGCTSWGDEESRRRCRVLYDLYMGDDVFTVQEIAERENISERTAYRDVNIGVSEMAVYLFGF